ncbi:MAG: hypothetical protein LBN21_11345 [Treponema sp.]|nr:hypothetical protein [Treponema sp.]
MKITGHGIPNTVKPEISGKNAAVKQVPSPSIPSGLNSQSKPTPQPVTARSSIFTTLGLPADKLSAALVAFVKYFSLPLDPALLAKLRRDVLRAQAASNPAPSAEKNGGPGAPLRASLGALLRAPPGEALSPKAALSQGALASQETLSLAAAAAADKGAALTPKGLENYALSLTGLSETGQFEVDPDGNNGAGGRPDNGGSEAGAGGRAGDTEKEAENSPEIDELKERIGAISEKNPLLNLLNRLPGKNGQRWVVLPFSFTEGEAEYRVSLRVLLRETPAKWPGGDISPKVRADRMALDISTGERRRRFNLEHKEGDSHGNVFSRLELLVWPPEKKRALDALQKTLADAFQFQSEQIIVKNDSEFPSFKEFSGDEVLPYVNKEV